VLNVTDGERTAPGGMGRIGAHRPPRSAATNRPAPYRGRFGRTVTLDGSRAVRGRRWRPPVRIRKQAHAGPDTAAPSGIR
jgi:hypothetical protein